MRQYLLLLLVSTFPVILAGAFSVYPFYTPDNSGCGQINTTTLKCGDGTPIVASFIVSAQNYSQFYGNFSAHTFAAEGVSQPSDIYGNACTVSSGGSSVCFITIPAIPVTALNGTLSRTIVVNLVSTKYPQLNFTQSFNISIRHYVNRTGYETAMLYNGTTQKYGQIGPQYEYSCGVYGICNESIGVGVSNAGQDLNQATTDINNGNISGAYIESEYANISLSSINSSFSSFENRSNKVINNIVQAQDLLNNANESYSYALPMLQQCNGTYAASMHSKLMDLQLVNPTQVVNNSYSYLYAANETNANLTGEIKTCEGFLPPTGSSLGQQQLSSKQISNKSSAGIPIIYVVLFPAALVLIYGVLKAKDMRETIRIRMAANEHDRKKAAESNGRGHNGGHRETQAEAGVHAQLPQSHQHPEPGSHEKTEGGHAEGGESHQHHEGSAHEKPE